MGSSFQLIVSDKSGNDDYSDGGVDDQSSFQGKSKVQSKENTSGIEIVFENTDNCCF